MNIEKMRINQLRQFEESERIKAKVSAAIESIPDERRKRDVNEFTQRLLVMFLDD